MKFKILWTKQTSFLAPCPSTLEQFSHMATCKSSLEYIGKMNLYPILNKNLPWAHTELEFDILYVARKLVKYVVHSSNKKIEFFSFFLLLITSYSNNKQPIFSLKEF
jgi:hypothetical protein